MAGLGKRARRQMKRITRGWRRSLVDSAPDWARMAFGPAAHYLDMLFVDHGVFRLIYVNRHRLGEHAWRSAQPAPHHIRALARQGIRTIVNLRGESVCGSYRLEQEACRRYGVRLVNFQVRSRAAPSRTEIKGALELFDRIEYPMLMHCKSGADRAGLMSVLYRYLKEGVPLEVAKRELSWRYGHFRQADTGILDYFFERYLQETATRPMAFFDWVEHVYDPVELKRSFKAQGWANQLVDRVLRRE
ncbi:MAG: protein tyrosine phosphatase [Hyphomicrobiaceae bacterium]|nr:protein tyrosine phosphatase [Hyphomicrobiaceae bacterium]